MSDAYLQVLDATIRHLEDLKARGVRFIALSGGPLSPQPRDERASLSGALAPVVGPVPAPVKSAGPGTAAPPAGPALATALDLSLGFADSSTGPSKAVPSPEARAAAFASLRERAGVCRICPHLADSRTQVVFGVGTIDAELMFVGEAPGIDEDQQGEPFVGKAGQLLNRILQVMGLSRQCVYIANILKCRPDTPGQTAGNRKPTGDEMKACLPYLQEQIDLIRPKVIVALGATAVEGLLGKTTGITRLRGHWQSYRGVPLMPTYHPAYLLRNQALAEKRKVWEDMLQVMEKLGMPISAKQRNFFLKGAS
jgi:uracil-DNA glycosylase family 4